MAPRIAQWIPRAGTYVEVFGGGAQVLFHLAPSPARHDVYNDVDQAVVEFFRVLRDPLLGPQLIHRLRLTPHARQEYAWARESWAACTDPVERVARWYTVARQSYGAHFGHGWGYTISPGKNATATWTNAVEALPAFSDRLRTVQIECMDWRAILEVYDTPSTTFYCDPPYVPDTRQDGHRYAYELTLADHAELVAALLQIRGQAVVSGYDHPVYAPLSRAWRRFTYDARVHVIGGGRPVGLRGRGARSAPRFQRTEVVWVSPGLLQPRQSYLWDAASEPSDEGWGHEQMEEDE
jgi:DNA adenine methylase